MRYSEYFSSIEEIIKVAKNGEMFILTDDENRENEGDLIVVAEKSTAEKINFMIRYGSGIVCLSLKKKRIEELQIPLIKQRNPSPYIQTNFTVPIEAARDVTTGVSAQDRNTTIKVAISPDTTYQDIVIPGHVFTLEAKEGGVLSRDGHTEASIDIAQIADLNPSAVICEIMNEDGTMARTPDIIKFATEHNLKIASIENLIKWRIKNEKLIEHISDKEIKKNENSLIIKKYYNKNFKTHHILIQKIDDYSKPVATKIRIIKEDTNFINEIESDSSEYLNEYINNISNNENFALLIVTESKEKFLSEKNKYLPEYGITGQILIDAKINSVKLFPGTDDKLKNYLKEEYSLNISA